MKGIDHVMEYLGLQHIDAHDGYSKVSMTVQRQHTNALGMTHGSVIFALADCAFGEASNFGDNVAVAAQVSINFLRPSAEGDVLTAEAIRVSDGKTLSVYTVTVRKGDKPVALFNGLVYKLAPTKHE
jgi:acyl-CoA thioesterase